MESTERSTGVHLGAYVGITTQKMDFISKCDQIRKKLWVSSHLLKKPLMQNFIFVQRIYGCPNITIQYHEWIRFYLNLTEKYKMCIPKHMYMQS